MPYIEERLEQAEKDIIQLANLLRRLTEHLIHDRDMEDELQQIVNRQTEENSG